MVQWKQLRDCIKNTRAVHDALGVSSPNDVFPLLIQLYTEEGAGPTEDTHWIVALETPTSASHTEWKDSHVAVFEAMWEERDHAANLGVAHTHIAAALNERFETMVYTQKKIKNRIGSDARKRMDV